MAKFNLGSLLGDRDLNNMISRVDDLVDNLGKNKTPDPELKDGSSNAINEFMAMAKEEDSPLEGGMSSIEKMLQNITIPAQRSNRYRIYDEIYSSVQIIKSIVRVYITSTIQKDIITGKSIVYVEAPEYKTDNDETKKYKKYAQAVINSFGIERQLNEKLLHDLLRYGDHYIELIDLHNDVANLPGASQLSAAQHSPTHGGKVGAQAGDTKILTDSDEMRVLEEAFDYIDKRTSVNGVVTEAEKLTKINDCVDKLVDCMCIFDDVSASNIDVHQHMQDLSETDFKLITEAKDDKASSGHSKIDSFEENMLNRILLRFHSPKNMVVLTTAHNNSIVGYVEVKEHKAVEVTPGVGMQFASVIKQISAISKSKVEDHSAVVRRIINRIIAKLVDKLDLNTIDRSGKTPSEVHKEYEDAIHAKLGDDLFYMVKRLYLESDPEKNEQFRKVNIRFIPRNRIIPLSLNPVEYSPYGTSIIDPLIYPGKLYLLSQLTNIVTKLSRAALIRKWTIETGPREQHTNLMQKLKRELRNQRITVDDIVSFKSIPKIMSDFKDMILLTKKGVKFVDVDVQSFGDPNIKIADLEDTRRELIALSGVPAPYLGYNDVVDLREQLVHVNITFATQIISIQSVVNNAMAELTDRICEVLGFAEKPSKYLTPALKPPVILLLQLLESTMSSIGNIQMSFQGTGIEYNPYYLLKKFVTSIDWDEFSKEAREYALFKKASTPPNSEDEGGGF